MPDHKKPQKTSNNTILRSLIVRTYQNWREDRTLRLGASLAYYSIFAIIPILTLMVLFANVIFSASEIRQFLTEALGTVVNTDVQNLSSQISQAVARSVERTNSNSLGVIGFVSLVISSGFIFTALQDAVDTIWKKPVTKGNFRRHASKYITAYLIVLIAIGSFLAAMAFQAATSLAGFLVPENISILKNIVDILVDAGGWVLAAIALSLIFKLLIHVDVSWKILIIGSLVTVLLATLGNIVLGWYLREYASRSISGAISSFFLVLIWIYYQAQILLVGAQFTRALYLYRKSIIVPVIGSFDK